MAKDKKPAGAATVVEAQNTEAAAPAQQTKPSYDRNEPQVRMNVSDKLIRDVHSNSTGRDFKSVRLPLVLPDGDGKVTWGNIAVSPKAVTPAEIITHENGESKIKQLENKSQVWLRGESSKVKVNLPDGVDENGKKQYKNVEYTAKDVAEMAKAGFAAYAKEKGSKEAPAVQQNDKQPAPPAKPANPPANTPANRDVPDVQKDTTNKDKDTDGKPL